MAQQGLVTRTMYTEIPPRVEYALTDKGRAALPIVHALRAFGDSSVVTNESISTVPSVRSPLPSSAGRRQASPSALSE